MKWEYLTFYLGELDDPKQENTLNNLGSLGWELVTVLPVMAIGCTAYFKRPAKVELKDDEISWPPKKRSLV